MRLQRLTGLERQKLEDELKELRAQIDDYRAILAEERRVLDIILRDLEEIRERYGDARRTEIVEAQDDVNLEDLISDEEVVVTVSREGYVKRSPLSTYRSQAAVAAASRARRPKRGTLSRTFSWPQRTTTSCSLRTAARSTG
jgi:DNA gyrase subunit A